ncbi:hypothetical protein STSO111631_09905 [Stackebrandtia soli]
MHGSTWPRLLVLIKQVRIALDETHRNVRNTPGQPLPIIAKLVFPTEKLTLIVHFEQIVSLAEVIHAGIVGNEGESVQLLTVVHLSGAPHATLLMVKVDTVLLFLMPPRVTNYAVGSFADLRWPTTAR